MDTARYFEVDPDDLMTGQEIFLVAAADGTEPLSAVFQIADPERLHVVLRPGTPAVSLPRPHWVVWAAKSFPLPAKADVIQLIHNALQQGNMTFEALADEILSLITGDIAPGVAAYQPPQAAAEEWTPPQVEEPAPEPVQVEVPSTYPLPDPAPDTASAYPLPPQAENQ